MNQSSSSVSGRGAIAELTEAIGDLFEQVIGLPSRLVFGGYPRHELRVEDTGFRVRVEMPGIQRDAIDVSVSGRKLRICAERPRFTPPEGARVLRRERGFGKVELTVQLPEEVDPIGVTARMAEGVLDVWLPKPSQRGRKVKVEADETASEPAGHEDRETTRPQGKEGDEEDAMPWEES